MINYAKHIINAFLCTHHSQFINFLVLLVFFKEKLDLFVSSSFVSCSYYRF